jgi:NAD(P)-dependent dehydrogenase (short-subunit alcohol dehydrogenase family)
MAEKSNPRVWFITGCSTGLGRVLAEEVLKAGDSVVATARRLEQVADLERSFPGQALALRLDVKSQAEVDAALAATLTRFGRVDVLVNNAGYGVLGAVEEVSEAEFMPMYETNIYGLLRVTRAFLPQLRKQRGGHILNLSSIGGVTAGAGWGLYQGTKFCVEGLSEALAQEVKPLGIRVTIVEPGPFRTDFMGRSVVVAAKRIADYDSTAAQARQYKVDQDGKQRGDPLKAAHAMMQVVESPNPPLRLLLGVNALKRVRAKLQSWQGELDAWQEVTLGADFPEGQ